MCLLKRENLFILVGFAIWYVTGIAFCYFQILCLNNLAQFQSAERSLPKDELSGLKVVTSQNLILVGVLTTNELLNSRVVTAHNTWAKSESIPGKVVYFSSENARNANLSDGGIKVVGLKGTDDSNPPHKKGLLTLKYMFDHYLEKFRFFMLVNDDTHVKGDQLGKFLHSIKSNSAFVFGKSGCEVINGDAEKLFYTSNKSNCTGGLGILVLTKDALRKIGLQVQQCLKNLHDKRDFETGQCVEQMANMTYALSNQSLFDQNYTDMLHFFNQPLETKDAGQAVNFHPANIKKFTYGLHQHWLLMKAKRIYGHLQILKREIDVMNHLLSPLNSSTGFPNVFRTYSGEGEERPRTADDVRPWQYITGNVICSAFVANPFVRAVGDETLDMNRTAEKIKEIINARNLSTIERHIQDHDYKYQYSRETPMHGKDYILYRSKREENLKIEKVYAHRPFLPLEMEEESGTGRRKLADVSKVRVNIIVPLAGRYSTFLKFIANFEETCLKTKEKVSLLLVLYRNEPNDSSSEIISFLNKLKMSYRNVPLSVIRMDGAFARGNALQAGADRFKEDDLMFFVDVDMVFQRSTLLRVRLNTVRGQRMYSPIVFSEYDPHPYFTTSKNVLTHHPSKNRSSYHEEVGYWRLHGFGMLSSYKSDFLKTGGYKLDIKGWGMEDNDIMDKFIRSDVSIFRSVDVDLRHNFHEITCDQGLQKTQNMRCVGTKVTTIAATETMAEHIYRTPDILNWDRNGKLA